MSDEGPLYLDAPSLDKLSTAQLGALKMVGGDLNKLPAASLLDMKATLSGSQPSTFDKVATKANDVVNTVGTGLAKGFTSIGGAAGDIRNLGRGAADWIGQKIGDPGFGEAYGKVARPLGPIGPTSTAMNKAVFSAPGETGPLTLPEVNADDNPALTLKPPMLNGGEIRLGKAIDAGISAIPSMMMLGGAPSALTAPGRAAGTVIPAFAGGALSELGGQATAGTPYEIPARIAGGVTGYLAGGKAVTPLRANLTPEETRLVALAKEKDIPLTVGQETGRGRGVESALARFPTSQGKMAALADEQATAINKDALAQAGATGERLDPTSMNTVIKNASADFEAAKNASGPVKLNTDFFKDLESTVGKYLETTPPSGVAPVVENRARDFVNVAKSGVPELSGEQYQQFRKGLNDAASSVRPGSGEQKALQSMRGALDDAMEASLPADQAEAWREVRRNWANLKILTKSAAGGTVGSRNEGNLSPSALSMALRSRQGADRFSSTTGGLNDTARVASYLADTIPNSGTPTTLQMQHLLTGAAPGTLPGFLIGGPAGAAVGAATSLAAPNLAARAMTGSQGFGWLRDYLANQAMTQAQPALPGGLKSIPFSLAPGVAVSAPEYPRLERRRK